MSSKVKEIKLLKMTLVQHQGDNVEPRHCLFVSCMNNKVGDELNVKQKQSLLLFKKPAKFQISRLDFGTKFPFKTPKG